MFRVHHVIEPLPVLQYDGSVRVTDEEEPDGVATLPQWTSRRILSSATRAVSWAWKRLFMSNSAFDAVTKTVVRLPITIPMIESTISISMSEYPRSRRSRPRRRAIIGSGGEP